MWGFPLVVANEINEELRRASSTEPTATAFSPGNCSSLWALNRRARFRSKSYIYKVTSAGKTALRNLAISILITPQPIMLAADISWFCKRRAPRAALAAVRFALTIDPSMTALGRPVTKEFRTMIADARSRPLSIFLGNEDIHLIPAVCVAPV